MLAKPAPLRVSRSDSRAQEEVSTLRRADGMLIATQILAV